jgi:serine/threonine protein phosphatase PrpC
VSRSLADFRIKGVSRIPAVGNHRRQDDDYRLVLCCDGVFDVINNEEIGVLLSKETDVSRQAYRLRNLAFGRGSHDNISTLVIDLTQP